VGRILRRLRQLRVGSLNRGDYAVETERSVENADAGAAAAGAHRGMDLSGAASPSANFPPNYVRQDDGRPRH
jgi:hypothetical protein